MVSERTEGASAQERPLVFFDGSCALCHRAVAFLAARDPDGRLAFASLQGAHAAALLPEPLREAGPEGTLVLREPPDGRLSTRSRALLRAFGYLAGPWPALSRLERLPGLPALLDRAYRFTARRRLGWFGSADQCALADLRLGDRLLD